MFSSKFVSNADDAEVPEFAPIQVVVCSDGPDNQSASWVSSIADVADQISAIKRYQYGLEAGEEQACAGGWVQQQEEEAGGAVAVDPAEGGEKEVKVVKDGEKLLYQPVGRWSSGQVRYLHVALRPQPARTLPQ